MAFNGGPPEDLQWQRVDVDPSGWETDTWHHMAGTWEGGTITLFVDGALVDESTQANGLTETPSSLDVGGGPLVLDELRISSIARSAEEIAARASAREGEASWMYVTDLGPSATQQALGRVGIDAQIAIDDRELPLVIGQRAYARGVAVRAPGFVEFQIPEGYQRLTGSAGLSPFGEEGASTIVALSVNGREVQVYSDLTAGDEPAPVSLDIEGGSTLRIEARVAGERPGAVAVVGDLMALAPEVEGPPSFSRQMEADEVTIQQMRTHVAEFEFDLPEAPKGYVIYAGHPVDRIDPALEPLGKAFPEAMSIQAAPGEYEAAQFTLCAARDLPSVQVTAGPLSGDAGVIPAEQVSVQLVRRVLMRRGYWMPRKPGNYEVVSRFIFPNRDFWLPKGNLKQVYLLVDVPEDTAPGEYAGTVSIEAEGAEATEMALNLTVHPIDLIQPGDKRYGMYYRMRNVVDEPEQMHAEFADMAAHGCTMIKGGAGIDFSKDEDGTITWDFNTIRTMLEGGREHGFFGEITVYDNLPRLASLMGYQGLDEEGHGEPVSEQEDLLDVARRCFAELKQ
ncbi:MAG: DUF6067 family protein, partial [Armatimonadota bacterium]|nr:DUF6067 family protein [Armatimonadota bacterium]